MTELAAPAPSSEPVLRWQNLQLDFACADGRVIQAVRGLTLTVRRGEILAIVGESGCGKSALLKSVLSLNSGQARIREGSILFYPAGQATALLAPEQVPAAAPAALNLLALSERELQALRGRSIGTVFQDSASALHPAVPAGRQIAAQARRCLHLSRRQALLRMQELCTALALPDPDLLCRQVPQFLSGGQKQRCALALALAGRPELLLADEITSALDPTVQLQLLRLLLQLKQHSALTVLLVTHDLGVAAAVADRIAVMYAGRLTEIGTAQEICSDPRHPYTRALLAASPERAVRGRPLHTIAGQPPLLIDPPPGDLFARRDPDALALDLVRTPPFFAVSPTHAAATWQLHPALCHENYPVTEEL